MPLTSEYTPLTEAQMSSVRRDAALLEREIASIEAIVAEGDLSGHDELVAKKRHELGRLRALIAR